MAFAVAFGLTIAIVSELECDTYPTVPAAPPSASFRCAQAWWGNSTSDLVAMRQPVCPFGIDPTLARHVFERTVEVRYMTVVAGVETPGGTGSGFIVNSSGLIVTAYHVVKDASRVVVHLRRIANDGLSMTVQPGRSMTVLSFSREHDTAILTPVDTTNVEWPSPLSVCLKRPAWQSRTWSFGFRTAWSVGMVHDSDNDLSSGGSGFSEHAMVYFGDSGGPVVNDAGAVIGVTVALELTEEGLAYRAAIAPALAAMKHVPQALTCD